MWRRYGTYHVRPLFPSALSGARTEQLTLLQVASSKDATTSSAHHGLRGTYTRRCRAQSCISSRMLGIVLRSVDPAAGLMNAELTCGVQEPGTKKKLIEICDEYRSLKLT